MRPLSHYISLLLASHKPTTMKGVLDGVKEVYNNIETPSTAWKDYSPTIKFSFVNPKGDDYDAEDMYDPTTMGSPFEFVAKKYPSSSGKPIAVYFPGLDCAGISASQQFEELSKNFELWRMTVTTDDRSSFSEITSKATEFLVDLTEGTGREAILIGESFGGQVAPVVALKLNARSKRRNASKNPVKGLVMVNPATSFDETNWDQLGSALANLRFLENEENASGANPYTVVGGLALSALIPDSTQFQQIVELILGAQPQSLSLDESLEVMSSGFGILGERLPASLIEHRVSKWLPVGAALLTDERLSSIEVPTLVLVGDDDKFLPSKAEADRLVNIIPSCKKINVKGSGHFVLDGRVNLTEAIIFSDIDPFELKTTEKKRDPILDFELPPEDQIQNIIDNRVQPLRRLTSPVFFSTDDEGKRWKGLGKLPSSGPILFIANHQFCEYTLH